MKIALAFLLAVLQTIVAVELAPISATSKAGIALLNKSRRLEGGEGEGEGGEGEGEGEGEKEGEEGEGEGEEEGNNNNNNNNADNNDYSWMQNYAIKFLGCHHVAHWNSNAEDANDVRLQLERHVRYRLCPSNSCSDKTGVGCTTGYGDYVVDMSTFLQSYVQHKEELLEEACESALNSCACGDDDVEKCEYKCYVNAGLEDCVEENPYYYYNNDDGEEFDLGDYTYCTQYDGAANDGGDGERLLRQLDQQEVEYFLGPYCSDKGDEIRFGMFTDDTCTEFADSVGGSTTFYETFGSSIPYYGQNLVDKDCYSCLHYDRDNYEYNTNEICTDTYVAAGKCETKMSSSYVYYPNENACTYIDGIHLLRHSANGIVYRPYRGTKWAAITIAVFATIFVLLNFYCCYLRKRVKVAMAAARAGASPREKKGFFKSLTKNLSPKSMKKKFRGRNRKDDALI